MGRFKPILTAAFLALGPSASHAQVRVHAPAGTRLAVPGPAANPSRSGAVPSPSVASVSSPLSPLSGPSFSPSVEGERAAVSPLAVLPAAPVSSEQPVREAAPPSAAPQPALAARAAASLSARSEKAAALVREEVASWGPARSPEDPIAASSHGRDLALAPASVRPTVQAPVVAPPARAGESASGWALPLAAFAVLVYALDMATKAFAVDHLFAVFHESAWRAPLMLGILPYVTGLALHARRTLGARRAVWRWSFRRWSEGRLGFYREELSGLDEMSVERPWLKGAVRVYDAAIAMMLGGLFGNGLDVLLQGGALDWIPLGRSLINLADVALLLGLAVFQLATAFFVRARLAHRRGEPLRLSTVGFLGLPLVGFFIAWAFGSAPSDDALNLALSHIGFVYLMGLSMLLGISRFLAALVVDRWAARFNVPSASKAPPA
ncbi:MAG: hypothetical protein HY403_03300 [Elusimicrobia bacterium]|nr:hypothetical protein [Elusimicrobiota bacterium]